MCLHTVIVAVDTEVTGEAVGSAPGHSKCGGMPGLAGLVLELAQFKPTTGILLASDAGNHPMLTMARLKYLAGILSGS